MTTTLHSYGCRERRVAPLPQSVNFQGNDVMLYRPEPTDLGEPCPYTGRAFHAPEALFQGPASAVESEELRDICWSLRRAWKAGADARIRSVYGGRKRQWD
jgi:hypothetical protein